MAWRKCLIIDHLIQAELEGFADPVFSINAVIGQHLVIDVNANAQIKIVDFFQHCGNLGWHLNEGGVYFFQIFRGKPVTNPCGKQNQCSNADRRTGVSGYAIKKYRQRSSWQ